MKKLIFTCLYLFTCVLPGTLLAQHHPLQEAIALRPYFILSTSGKQAVLKEAETIVVDNSNPSAPDTIRRKLRPDIQSLFSSYNGNKKLDQENINNTFDTGNPYLTIEYTSNFGLKDGKMEEMFREGPAPSGSNPVSTIADGIARFLVKRTKEELALAFFDDFKKKVEQDSLYFKYFFGNTKDILQLVDTDVFQFQIYLESLREAFVSDLRVLPGNMSDYLSQNPLKQLKPSKQAIAVDFFEVVQMTIDGAPSLNMIRLLANDTTSAIQSTVAADPELKNLSAGLKLVNQISESLFDSENGRWYTGAEIKAELADPVTLRIYLGLLWHNAQMVQAEFKNGTKLTTLIGKAAENATMFQNWQLELARFGDNAEEMQESLDMRADKSTSLSDNFSRCLQMFTRILESANTLNALFNPGDGQAIESKYLQLIQQVGSLHFNTRQKHYSAAIGNSVYILDVLLGKGFKGEKELLKYGMFIAAVAESENATEVQNAIELFALPPGSSKAKKGAGKFSVAVNAYTGFSGAAERFKNSSTSEGVVGVAAPVGFSVNWGKSWGKKKKDASIGLFFPVLDVGAVLAYRFKDDGVENLPPMEWKNLVAPGAYFVVDPPAGKWPLTLGFGGQMGPLLREVEDNGTLKNKDVGAYRIGGFITLDIPVTYLRLKSSN